MFENGLSRRTLLAGFVAVLLLGVFMLVNYYLTYQDKHQPADISAGVEREKLPANLEGDGRRLAFHDFESGNATDTASHLATRGHTGKQSLKMNSRVNFSPGLWIKFKELNPGDGAWIRATGYVWFSGSPSDVKCCLVATCNHQGVNFKYMFVALEKEKLQPNRWNRISIDYQIPPPPDREDVVQAYFWYRGNGEMLVDDVEVTLFKPKKEHNRPAKLP
jgi:hypothetical protein